MESGGASGWPGTDWIASILLAESGPEVYDQWVNHEIPWTDPSVKSAFEKFGLIGLTEGYVPGGADFILSTNFVPASYLPFESPPKARMYHLGSFTAGFISEQFPDLVAEEDYDFFPFPPVNPANLLRIYHESIFVYELIDLIGRPGGNIFRGEQVVGNFLVDPALNDGKNGYGILALIFHHCPPGPGGYALDLWRMVIKCTESL